MSTMAYERHRTQTIIEKSRGYLAASPTRLKSCRYTTVAFSI